MKSTKTLFLAALAVGGLMASIPLHAQDSSTNNMPMAGSSTNATRMLHAHTANVDKMAQVLGLTDQQKSQVQTLYTEQSQKVRAIIQDTTLSRDDKRNKIMDLRKESSEQMKSILTPEQYQKWNSAMQSRMRRMTPPQGGSTTNAPSGQQ